MKLTVELLGILVVVSFSTATQAADQVAWLSVRYSNGAVKTFVQGPYTSKASCDKLNQITWDNVLTACGSCKVEQQFCIPAEQLTGPFAKGLRKEPVAIPYVVATSKGRIFLSGIPTSEALAECERLASEFRRNGYPKSVCVLPP